MRLLQQTLRTSQSERPTAGRPAPAPDSSAASDQTQTPVLPQGEVAQLEELLKERDGQIQSMCGHMERLALEKESLQKELKALKLKVGEINDQLGMLMETIQAKDEVIMKLSQENFEQGGNPNDAGSPPPHKELQELKVEMDEPSSNLNLELSSALQLLFLRLFKFHLSILTPRLFSLSLTG